LPGEIIRPPALRKGDKVALIAPASSFSRDGFLAGCERLRQMGYEPVYAQDIFDRDLYFAGAAERRSRELSEFWQREDVRALICVRGGYGANYLLSPQHAQNPRKPGTANLEQLDFDLFARQPKILVGCSDITTLLTAIHDRTGLVTFHGPMVAKDLAAGTFDLFSWNNCLSGAARAKPRKPGAPGGPRAGWEVPADGVEVLRQGRARARLYGGCLSMLVASLGTPFEIETEDTILFIEDVAEKPYRIDRMLMQLRLAGKLESVRGFVFGEMLDCLPPHGESYTLQQVIMRVLAPYQVPVVFGLKSGHVTSGNITLPIGVQAELRAANEGAVLRILESATLVAGPR
jgi:muramoyltetrapeptide carboxypeptidase